MSSDYEYSDDDGDYYDEDELMDQNEEGERHLTISPAAIHSGLLSDRFRPIRRGDGH